MHASTMTSMNESKDMYEERKGREAYAGKHHHANNDTNAAAAVAPTRSPSPNTDMDTHAHNTTHSTHEQTQQTHATNIASTHSVVSPFSTSHQSPSSMTDGGVSAVAAAVNSIPAAAAPMPTHPNSNHGNKRRSAMHRMCGGGYGQEDENGAHHQHHEHDSHGVDRGSRRGDTLPACKSAKVSSSHTSPSTTHTSIAPVAPIASSRPAISPAAAAVSHVPSSSASAAATAAATTAASHTQQVQAAELVQMQNLALLTSFANSNRDMMWSIYREIQRECRRCVEEAMELNEPKLIFKFPQYQPQAPVYAMETIPGYTWHMGGTPPGFYLPKLLRRGRNTQQARWVTRRDVNDPNVASPAAVTASHTALLSPSSTGSDSIPSCTFTSASDTSSASASTKSSTPPPNTAAAASSSSNANSASPFVDWCLAKLCDVDLQRRMEAHAVLNASNEGSYLSVLNTDGDGNCLCHAILGSVYGCADWKGALRDAAYWCMSASEFRPQFLSRFLNDSAKEIASARAIDAVQQSNPQASPSSSQSSSGGSAAPLDADDERALTVEFERCIEMMSDAKNYLEPIHIFVLAHVLRRPIIVYGNAFLSNDTDNIMQQPHDAQGDAAMSTAAASSASSPAPSSSSSSSSLPCHQRNSMMGIYLPLLFDTQYKFNTQGSEKNAILKPICLLYSCADESTGRGGHFSALVPTAGIMPDPPLVPLMQYEKQTPGGSNASSSFDLDSPPYHLLPIRFLLPNEQNVRQHHILLRKHMEIQVTSSGEWFARAEQCHTQKYIDSGWLAYLQRASILYTQLTGQQSGMDAELDFPAEVMAAALAAAAEEEEEEQSLQALMLSSLSQQPQEQQVVPQQQRPRAQIHPTRQQVTRDGREPDSPDSSRGQHGSDGEMTDEFGDEDEDEDIIEDEDEEVEASKVAPATQQLIVLQAQKYLPVFQAWFMELGVPTLCQPPALRYAARILEPYCLEVQRQPYPIRQADGSPGLLRGHNIQMNIAVLTVAAELLASQSPPVDARQLPPPEVIQAYASKLAHKVLPCMMDIAKRAQQNIQETQPQLPHSSQQHHSQRQQQQQQPPHDVLHHDSSRPSSPAAISRARPSQSVVQPTAVQPHRAPMTSHPVAAHVINIPVTSASTPASASSPASSSAAAVRQSNAPIQSAHAFSHSSATHAPAHAPHPSHTAAPASVAPHQPPHPHPHVATQSVGPCTTPYVTPPHTPNSHDDEEQLNAAIAMSLQHQQQEQHVQQQQQQDREQRHQEHGQSSSTPVKEDNSNAHE